MQEKHSRDREMKVDCLEKKMFLSKRMVKRIFLLIFVLFIVFVHKGYSEDNAVKTEAGQAEAVQPSPQNVSLEILEAVKKEKIDLAKKEEKMKEEEKRLNERDYRSEDEGISGLENRARKPCKAPGAI